MKQNYLALIFFLLSTFQLSIRDVCYNAEKRRNDLDENGKVVKIDGRPFFNLKPYFKTEKNINKIRRGGQASELMTIDINGKQKEILVMMISARGKLIYDLYSNDQIGSRTISLDLISCEYDDDFLYIAKNYITLSEMCVEKLYFKKNGFTDIERNNGDTNNLRHVFSFSGETLGEGSFGVVKGFHTTINGVKTDIALKRIDRTKLEVMEIFILKSLEKSRYGAKMLNCEYDQDFVYIAQEQLMSHLDSASFLKVYHSWSIQKQIQFLIELVEAVVEFADLGFVHSDLKSQNAMVDKNFTPKLIDFGGSVSIKGRQSRIYSGHFYTPLRERYPQASTLHDLYSIAQMIVALESKVGSKIFNKYYKTIQNVDPSCYKNAKIQRCYDNYKNILLGVLQPKWGMRDKNHVELHEMNLTDLIYQIVVIQDRHIDLEEFLVELKRIKLVPPVNIEKAELLRRSKSAINFYKGDQNQNKKPVVLPVVYEKDIIKKNQPNVDIPDKRPMTFNQADENENKKLRENFQKKMNAKKIEEQEKMPKVQTNNQLLAKKGINPKKDNKQKFTPILAENKKPPINEQNIKKKIILL